MHVENNLVMVIMGLLAVAVVLLVLFAMYPILVSWAACATRWCCGGRASRAGDETNHGGAGDASPPGDGDGRWMMRESAMSVKMGSVNLSRQASTVAGARSRRNFRSGDRIPNSRGVVWNARVFEGRPTVVTMDAPDPLSDLDTWHYETRYLEAHWHVPSETTSSSGNSVEIRETDEPSSEEALAIVHPMSPVPVDGVSEAVLQPAAAMVPGKVSNDVPNLISTASENYSSSSSSSADEERDRRKIVCPSVPPNALLRYVWGARPLATVPQPTAISAHSEQRPLQTVSVYAAGPSSLPGSSRLGTGGALSPPRTSAPAGQPSLHLASHSSRDN